MAASQSTAASLPGFDSARPIGTMAGGLSIGLKRTPSASGASQIVSSGKLQDQLVFDWDQTQTYVSHNAQQGEAETSPTSPEIVPKEVRRIASPLFNHQPRKPSPEVLAEWDGYVESIDADADYFTARMRGLHGDGVEGKDEEAEIPISDVDDEDRDLLTIGAFFRLTITYESRPKRRYTTVQFRRLPAYTKRELDGARALAEELFNGLRLGSCKSASGD